MTVTDSQLHLNIVPMPGSYSAAIKRGEDNEDEDLDRDHQHGQTSGP
jgi:hypothetical protein